jgi:hypothetical protein
MNSRRFMYLVPAKGAPRKLVHRIEAGALDALPGEKSVYLRWEELEAGVKELVSPYKKVAMEYSPKNAIPYVSIVDAGTVELVKSAGVEIHSSGDLIQVFAAAWDDAHFGDRLGAKDLVLMTTKNPASVVAHGGTIGSLAPGYVADIAVYAPKSADPYEAIVAATPRDVRLTMVGGRVLYGDASLVTLGPALLLLGALRDRRLEGAPARALVTFGQVPLFFYLLHLPLVHALSIPLRAHAGLPLVTGAFRHGLDVPLGVVYAAWVVAVALLWPPCRAWAELRRRSRAWWLGYL